LGIHSDLFFLPFRNAKSPAIFPSSELFRERKGPQLKGEREKGRREKRGTEKVQMRNLNLASLVSRTQGIVAREK